MRNKILITLLIIFLLVAPMSESKILKRQGFKMMNSIPTFNFTTDYNIITFHGRYDGENLTGMVFWSNMSNYSRLGVGTYQIEDEYTGYGRMSINFKDPNNPLDLGLQWTGTFDFNQWILARNGTMINGTVVQSPQ